MLESKLILLLILAFAVIQSVGIWAAVDVVMKGRTAQGAVAWSIALLLVPFAALPFYFVFGDRRFAGYVKARRAGTLGINRIAQQLYPTLAPYAPSLRADARLAGDLPALERLVRLPFTSGNQTTLLINGQATFDAIIAAIDAAERYVLVQFYIFRDDSLGNRFRDSLLKARRRGVRVCLLYDEIGSHKLSESWLDALRTAGAQVSGFRTKRHRQWWFRLNFRNHRKIVVVDGRVAFLGGHNVGNEYLGLDPKFGMWRDTHIVLRGPAVQCVQLVFVEDWYWSNRSVPELDWSVQAQADPGAHILVVPSGPADDVDTCELMFTHLINTATRRLWIASPYFVPDEQIIAALQLASLRGVDVRLLIPDRGDSVLTWLSAFTYYEDILPRGVKVFRYTAGFMHQKVMLSDDLCAVGTANLDNRSFRINFEITLLCSDAAASAEVAAMLQHDLESARQVQPDEFDRRPYWFRLAARVARLLSPIQ